jgi:TonB family protein
MPVAATQPAATPASIGALLPAQAGLAALYPLGALSGNWWGNVRLRLQVDAQGCIRSATISGSSGSAALDAAALQWSDSARLAPAVSAGHAIASSVVADVQFAIGTEANDDDVPASIHDASSSGHGPALTMLGGVRLGMTRQALRQLKGEPISVQGAAWLYNSRDAAHDGLLTVSFGYLRDRDRERDPVIAVEYVGAPQDLPPLLGQSLTELVHLYGAPVHSDRRAGMADRLLFSNGLMVTLLRDRVTAYGISLPELRARWPEVRVVLDD